MTQAENPPEDQKEEPVSTEPGPKKYPLGVLFVHGIGEQVTGDTLKNVVDPVVRSLDLWVHGAVRCRALSLGQTDARSWADRVPVAPHSPAHTATLREHANEMAELPNWQRESAKPERPPAMPPETPWGGSAVLRDGQPPQSGKPAHAVLQLQTVDAQYQVTQAQALLAECWWARSFVPPSAWALLAWTFKVLPLAIGMHVTDLFHGHVHQARNQALKTGWRLWHRFLALVWLLALTPVVMLALPAQVALTASVVLSLLPIRFVQDAMRALQSVLLGTLGDSFLLVSSPVSRAMIVAQCKRDLQWLAGQCEQVMLVAHSQGCAVSYLALCEHKPAELTEVSWVGSGLRKLEALRTAERNPVTVSAAWLVATMPPLVCGLAHHLWSRPVADDTWLPIALLVGFLMAWFIGFCQLIKPIRTGATAIWLSSWRGLKLRLRDIHATHDPVPHGPLSHDDLPADGSMTREEVHNLASRVGDHVSYWRNVEEVSLPLALRMARGMGLPLERLTPDDDARRDAAVRRRRHRVHWLVWLRAVLWSGALALVISGLDQWLAFGRVAIDQGLSWDGFSTLDVKPLVPSLRMLGPALLLWLVVPYATMVLIWNGWEAHEQRAFLSRTEPEYWLGIPIVAGLVAAAASPMARALVNVWPDAWRVTLFAVAILSLAFAFVAAAEMSNAFKPPAKKSP
ncbi:MAG: hypothetical protein ABW190_09535 [Rhizobacter sp.]